MSNLDAQLREEMRAELKDIHRAIGVTAIYVTHDQAEAMSLSDTIVVMGEGEILQVGSPRALYEEPADVRVARFIGKANVFDAVVVDAAQPIARVRIDGIGETFGCRVSGRAAPQARGALSIRPEAIALKPANAASQGVRGRIGATVYLGNLSQYQVELGPGRMVEVQQVGSDLLQGGRGGRARDRSAALRLHRRGGPRRVMSGGALTLPAASAGDTPVRRRFARLAARRSRRDHHDRGERDPAVSSCSIRSAGCSTAASPMASKVSPRRSPSCGSCRALRARS